MTEPSKAAKRKAREIAEVVTSVGSVWLDYETALARVLQEHSDKAKIARDWDSGHAEARLALESIILPDEPCKHTVSYIWIGGDLASNYCGIRCSKCGKSLKIVEVGDD